ncbi:MAG TPA: sugar-transfer associated ATP-grasp domain-containing protein [Caulobacteraceae bacterium]
MRAEAPMIAVLARMAEQTGAPPTRLLGEFASLALGAGRLTFTDYARLRLYDDAFWAGADKKTVIGERRNRDICQTINQHRDGGLFANRLATAAYLGAFGFPVPGVVATFAKGVAAPGPRLLRGRGDLRQFLAAGSAYPLFASPIERKSHRARIITGFDRASEMLEFAGGARAALDSYIDDVSECERFLFQEAPAPHPFLAALAGSRLAPVSLVTLTAEDEPRVLRAAWRIPVDDTVGRKTRRGDLLARVDFRSGAVLRVTRGLGLDLEEVTRHPTTGARLIGATVPDWQSLKATAIEAARATRPLALIGWEVAPCASGPMILGATETPDLSLGQLVDRKGLLDADFCAFLADHRQTSADGPLASA